MEFDGQPSPLPITNARLNDLSPSMVMSMTLKKSIGEMSGKVMETNLRHFDAPITMAAS